MDKLKNPNLTEEQKKVLFEKATEVPFSGAFLNNKKDGSYTCANCGNILFLSQDKYESTTPGLIGWPSFDTAVDGAVRYIEDNSMLMKRTEVLCRNCGSHLGHVFDADDAPSGTHFCINSLSLDFIEQKNSKN